MSLRWIALAALVGGGASSYASFDLFIAPDASNLGYVRYDPVNRVALGTIVISGGSRVTAVASKPNGLYQYSGGWAQVNNSTGERVSLPAFTSNTLLHSRDGNLIASQSSNALLIGGLNTSGLYSSTANWAAPVGFTITGATAYVANRWLVYGYSAAGLGAYLVSDAGTTVASPLGMIPLANMLTTGIGQGAIFSRAGSDYGAIPYRNIDGTHRLMDFALNSTIITNLGFQTVSGYSTANVNTNLCAVAGHTGFWLVGSDVGTPTSARIQEYDDVPSYVLISATTTSAFAPPVTGQWRMSNLVAPEPAEWMAMSVGLVALLGRRRRR